MTAERTIALRFADELTPIARARIDYAYRVFAAVYGYRVTTIDEAQTRIVYTTDPKAARDGELLITPHYAPRPADVRAPAPHTTHYAGERFHVFFGLDERGRPDFLGEIFEWVSNADEHAIRSRDEVGRIPYRETVFARHNISPVEAHASRMMAWLESELHGKTGTLVAARPERAHEVICSHDIDFYYSSRGNTLKRLAKNLAIASRGRDFDFGQSTVRELVRLVAGQRVGDYLPGLATLANERAFTSTVFAIPRSPHRRDANYEISSVTDAIRDAGDALELGMHASYTSAVERQDLASEADLLRRISGRPVAGNRQHWLRFGTPAELYALVERAGFAFDSSLAHREASGFRNGLCAAFPPYDFTHERACKFLEIPLVLMDTTLADLDPPKAMAMASAVLSESRRWGWGGVAILWHDPLESLGVTTAINQIFHELLAERPARSEEWVSGSEFVERRAAEYRAAGFEIDLNGSRRS